MVSWLLFLFKNWSAKGTFLFSMQKRKNGDKSENEKTETERIWMNYLRYFFFEAHRLQRTDSRFLFIL